MTPLFPDGAELSSINHLLKILGFRISGSGRRNSGASSIALFRAAFPMATEEQVLLHHTVYPLFRAFLRYQYAGKYAVKHGSISSKSSLVFSSRTKSCAKCRAADLATYGYFFSRVVHQFLPVEACHLHGYPLEAACTCRKEYQGINSRTNCAHCNGSGWVAIAGRASAGQYHHANFLLSIFHDPEFDIRSRASVLHDLVFSTGGWNHVDLKKEILKAWECSSPEEFHVLTRIRIDDVVHILDSGNFSAARFFACTTSIGTALAILAGKGIDFVGPLSPLRRKGKHATDSMVIANRKRALQLAYGEVRGEFSGSARKRLKDADPLVYRRCVKDKAWFDENIPTSKSKPWFTPKRPATLELAVATLRAECYRSVDDLQDRRKHLYEWLARNHPAVLADSSLFAGAECGLD